MGAVGADKTAVGWFAVSWNFGVVDENDGVGADDSAFETLGKTAEFIGGRALPEELGPGIGDELAIFHALASVGVDDSVGKRSATEGGWWWLDEHLGEGSFRGGLRR